MFAKFFQMPYFDNGHAVSFNNLFTFATDRIVELSCTRRFTKIGEFSLVLPFEKDYLSGIKLNGIIYIDGLWLWIRSVTYDGKRITVSGQDCKGLLGLRVALPAASAQSGAEGYDVYSDKTAKVIAHYVENNLIRPEDTDRKIPMSIENLTVYGKNSDSYMARFEYISDIVAELCEGAEIGWDVIGHLGSSGFGLQILGGTDRSWSQNVNPRVIFSPKHRNVRSYSFEHGVTDLKNVIYGTDPNGYTQTVYRSGTPEGLSRCECNVSVSVNTGDMYFKDYALDQVSDNVETHSYTLDTAASGYGTEYFLGDIVSVWDEATGDIYNGRITEVTTSISAGQKSVTVVLGTQRLRPLQKINNSLLSGTAGRR